MNKYRNKRTNGYASKREAKRAAELAMLEKIGAIRNLQTQVKYELTPRVGNERASHYVADFVYEEDSGLTTSSGEKFYTPIVEDCKGMRTPLYVLKRKIMRHRYKIEIRET